jgi:hypothetical protein
MMAWPTQRRPEMPTNVRRFVWLWWGSFVIALIEIPLMPPPSASELRLGVTRSGEMAIAAGLVAILLAVILPFYWLAVRRRKNWARWVLLVTFVSGNALFFVPFPSPPPGVDPSWLHTPPSVIVVACLSLITEAAAFYFLFTGDARAWFRGGVSN